MPKRSPSAYNLYVKDAIPEIRRSEPGLSFGEYMKKCSAQWKALSGGDQQVYITRAAQAKEEFMRKKNEESLSDDLKGDIARLENAIDSMRSSAKKTELLTCVSKVKQRIQSIYDEYLAPVETAV